MTLWCQIMRWVWQFKYWSDLKNESAEGCISQVVRIKWNKTIVAIKTSWKRPGWVNQQTRVWCCLQWLGLAQVPVQVQWGSSWHAVMASWSIILSHQVMIMLKFSTQAKTLFGFQIHLPPGRFKYDWFSNTSFLSADCSQPGFFLSLYSFMSGGLAHVLIHEATCLPSELLGVTVWKCENAIVRVYLTSAYFKSLLVKMMFFSPT